jgi:hypothetical protein
MDNSLSQMERGGQRAWTTVSVKLKEEGEGHGQHSQ